MTHRTCGCRALSCAATRTLRAASGSSAIAARGIVAQQEAAAGDQPRQQQQHDRRADRAMDMPRSSVATSGFSA